MFAAALLVPILLAMTASAAVGVTLITISLSDAARFGTLSIPVLVPGLVLTLIPIGFGIAWLLTG